MTRGITGKKLVRAIGIILFVGILFGYGIWRSRDLLFGIKLVESGITDGMTSTTGILEFSGTARHARGITVNGRVVPLSQDGAWHDTLALPPGYSVVTIVSSDRFGRSRTERYRVEYVVPK